jgi:hypothetical protein
MISQTRNVAEAYLPGVPRLGMSGAVLLPFLSAFMMWGEKILVYPYLIGLSVTRMALNDRMIGK